MKAIAQSKKGPGNYISSVFLIPETDSGTRLLLNLKLFNNFASTIHFKMENLQNILYLVDEGYWMSVLDLLDAYLGIPITNNHRRFLKFKFEGVIYKFLCLPFGYKDFSHIFLKVLKPILRYSRLRGHILVFYLDDGWQGAPTYKGCLAMCIATYSLLVKVSFLPNLKNSPVMG